MATAEINELFEQAATLAADLTDTADEAAETIEEVVDRAGDLAQRVASEGEEAGRLFKELTARLEQAEQELADARERAKAGFDALAGKAGTVGETVAELLNGVKDTLAGLEAQREKLDGDLDTRGETASRDFEEFTRKVQELEAATGQQLEQAGEDIGAFRTAVEAARDELAGRKSEWLHGLEELQTSVMESVKTWASGMMGLLGGQTETMVGLANHAIDRHNETMEELKQLFTEQAVAEVTGALEPVQDALTKLGELAVARQGDLTGAAGQIVGKVQAALPVLEQIRTALAAAQALG
jgi:DNA repair exonuclease SbcCD ATPase subunit